MQACDRGVGHNNYITKPSQYKELSSLKLYKLPKLVKNLNKKSKIESVCIVFEIFDKIS